jgi:hypothetical protein
MTTESHSTAIELSEPAPAEVAAGTELTLKIKLACEAGCDLHSLPITIKGPDDAAATDCHINDSGEVALRIPSRIGAQSFTIAFGPHEAADICHEPCAISLTVKSIPHGTSLAVWDIPSPIMKGEQFAIKVGAKSAADAELNGFEIAIFDISEKVVARGRLRDAPWPGTTALYWDELQLTAPAQEGLHKWSARFAAEGLALPHDGTAAEFSAMVAPAPEHCLTVKVVEQQSKKPIADVQVRLGPFHGTTGATGIAEVMMPKGTYDLHIWKTAYEAPDRPIEIKGDLSVQVEAVFVPEEDPDNAWTM